MREIPATRPITPLMRIVLDGKDGGTSHQTMMTLLLAYPYQNVRPSSAYAPPGANLERQMEGWESMPYPQPDTIQEIIVAVQRKQLARGSRCCPRRDRVSSAAFGPNSTRGPSS